QNCIYIPNILSIVVIAAIFSAILNPTYGVMKAIANLFNASYTGWLGNTKAVMWCIAFAMIWQAVGYYMVMYIAGMDSVPDHLYEAADLEGCGKMRQFFVITVPMTWEVIRTTLTFFIISTINMSFLFVDSMTQGEANSHVLLTFMYKFFNDQYGYAMAIGTVIFVLAYTLSLIIQRLTRREIIEY
ncbi:MAG: ABC transporter permease, partial [Bacillota bacterium]